VIEPPRRQALQPGDVARPQAPYSPVVISGDHVFTAGQVGFDLSGELVPGGIEAQTRQALENVRGCLEAAGCGLGDVVKVSAFLADLGDFPAYNAAYREFFDEPFPVRTTVQAGLPPGILVEIDAIAHLKP
jgi:2-iminobutanoate/2-iminopropanoate deaminase